MKSLFALILALAVSPFASPVDGPQASNSSVNAYDTDRYSVSFYGGETGLVTLSGSGNTDLDLYIYDNNGNLVCQSITYGDDEWCSWTPAWTGTFIIKIKNRGSIYNSYRLTVQ